MTEKREVIRNKELIAMLRNRTVEVGDCYIWQQGVTGGGAPVMWDGSRVIYARRMAYSLHTGMTMAKLDGLYVWQTCGNMRCISPHCWGMGTRGDMTKAMAALGRLKIGPQRAAKIAIKARIHSGRFPGGMEQVRQIRDRIGRGERARDIAKEFGVHPTTISKIVAGVTWREQVAGSSVFNQLTKVAA